MFIVGAVAFYVRMTPGKAIRKARQLLVASYVNKHDIEATISRLNLIQDRDLVDECKELAVKLRAKLRTVDEEKRQPNSKYR